MTKPAAGAPWSLIGGRVVHPRSAAGAPTTEPASDLPDFMRVWKSRAGYGWMWSCDECPWDSRSPHLTGQHAVEGAAKHIEMFHARAEAGT